MIIGLDNPEKIGTVIEGTYYLTPKRKKIKGVRCMILRESTYEEWKEYRRQNNLPINFKGTGNGFYYQVSVD